MTTVRSLIPISHFCNALALFSRCPFSSRGFRTRDLCLNGGSGLEREHNCKAGVRTFALTALLGCLGGLLGGPFAPIAIAFATMMVAFMNWRQIRLHGKLAMTNSAALMIVPFVESFAARHTWLFGSCARLANQRTCGRCISARRGGLCGPKGRWVGRVESKSGLPFLLWHARRDVLTLAF